MVGIFKIATSFVAARVGGDQVVLVVEAEAIGERFENEALGDVGAGHRVAVGVKNNPATVGDTHGSGDGGIGSFGGQRM